MPTPRSLLPLALLPLLATACPPTVGEGKSEDECSDGLDNDGDGATDCLDAGCMGFSICGGETGEPDDTETHEVPDDPDVTDQPVVEDPEVIINEFMASNASTIADPEDPKAFPDWIELVNLTDQPIDLAGYMLTDNLRECDQHVLAKGVTIPAAGYLVLWVDNDEEEGPLHLNFALNKEGEEIGLCRPDMQPLTKLSYGAQVTDYSAARLPDGGSTWDFDGTATPGAANEL